jgi:uncharacterized protein
MHSLPIISNSNRFVERRESVDGAVLLSELPRLADRLAPGLDLTAEPPLTWKISGTHDSEGRAALSIFVEGNVPLACQRCLGRLDYWVSQTTVALIARSEAELIKLDDATDMEVLLCDKGIDTLTLIEDELLLTLPFSPMHEVGDPECVIGASTLNE